MGMSKFGTWWKNHKVGQKIIHGAEVLAPLALAEQQELEELSRIGNWWKKNHVGSKIGHGLEAAAGDAATVAGAYLSHDHKLMELAELEEMEELNMTRNRARRRMI